MARTFSSELKTNWKKNYLLIFKIENKAVGQKEKVGTSKERRAKARKEQTPKGTNYYSTANVKNKNKNKKAVQELKEKFSKGKKTGQRKWKLLTVTDNLT